MAYREKDERAGEESTVIIPPMQCQIQLVRYWFYRKGEKRVRLTITPHIFSATCKGKEFWLAITVKT